MMIVQQNHHPLNSVLINDSDNILEVHDVDYYLAPKLVDDEDHQQ